LGKAARSAALSAKFSQVQLFSALYAAQQRNAADGAQTDGGHQN
jgi:hypothetical protein